MSNPSKPTIKQKNLDLSAHDEQGEQGEHLQAMRAYLVDMHIRLAGTYGTSSREAKLAERGASGAPATCITTALTWWSVPSKRRWKASTPAERGVTHATD